MKVFPVTRWCKETHRKVLGEGAAGGLCGAVTSSSASAAVPAAAVQAPAPLSRVFLGISLGPLSLKARVRADVEAGAALYRNCCSFRS